MSPTSTALTVPLEALEGDLVLDAGRVRPAQQDGEPGMVVEPPTTPLVVQIVEYLDGLPEAPGHNRPLGLMGVALAALTVRFGSYYAVLADGRKPLWEGAKDPAVGRIRDSEMKRINLEASSALARLIVLWEADPDYFWSIARRAVHYLPVTRKRSSPAAAGGFGWMLQGLAYPAIRSALAERATPELLETRRKEAARRPHRVVANTVLNGAWRNGPIEEIHAGRFAGNPLDHCRVSRREDVALFARLSDNLHSAAAGLQALTEGAERGLPWAERALGYHLCGAAFDTALMDPVGWSLDDATASVWLPAEPEAEAGPWRRR